jgi:hypothetical protein
MKWGTSLSRMRPKCLIQAIPGIQASGFYWSHGKVTSNATIIFISHSYGGKKMELN